MVRFAGFELDQNRAELRGPDGRAIKLRPKTFDLLLLFVGNPGRILTKQELMEAVWPNVHVGEDSLFQCIRDLRAALGDDDRQIVKLVSGRGYMFEAEVTRAPTAAESNAASDTVQSPQAAALVAQPRAGWRLGGAVVAVAGLAAVVGLAFAAPLFKAEIPAKRMPSLSVLAVADANQDAETATLAAAVTSRLIDGFAKIGNIRVVAPNTSKASGVADLVAAPAGDTDYVVRSELSKGHVAWILRTRMVKVSTGDIESVPAVTVDEQAVTADLVQTRLAAGVGHLVAARINALLDNDANPAAESTAQRSGANVAIEQATASIMQTSRERFSAAQGMLEKALAEDPNNADLQVALAALQLRGIQMVWYSPAETSAAEANAKTMLERAVRTKPNAIPVLEAYCRFLNATNEFVDSLVACARALAFDPWNGIALYHMGVAHLQLGRFEDALATFKQADRYDTPQVSRWTWLLGVGWSYLMMGHDEEALPWLEKSIAITPASGRPLMLLAAAYQRTGRPDEAKAALAKALQVRPGSTTSNISLPLKNSSPAFLAASDKIKTALVQLGLPDR